MWSDVCDQMVEASNKKEPDVPDTHVDSLLLAKRRK